MSTQQADPNLYAQPGIFQNSYSAITYAGVVVGTLYCGLFVMLNNYYVFRPKLQKYAKRFITNSHTHTRNVLRQTMVNLILCLTALTFCLSSVLLSGSTNNIEAFVVSDSIWMGIYASVILYRQRDQPSKLDWKYALKNSVMLSLAYACLLVHVQLNFYFITFGAILLLLAVINQLTNVYFHKIERYINRAFFMEEQEDLPPIEHLYTPKPIYPDIETLSQTLSKDDPKLSDMSAKYLAKRNGMKLKSKAIVYQKLHEIFIRVAVSLKQHKQNEDRKTIQYYGRLNGTIPIDNKQKIAETKESFKRMNQLIESKQEMSDDEIDPVQQEPVEEPPGCLTYMFPIKMLEYTQPISVVFSIAINLGYGVLLDYTLQIMRSLSIGNVFNCLFAITILPIIPKMDIAQLNSSMTVSSVFRYGLVGLAFIIQSTIFNSNKTLTLKLSIAQPLVYIVGLQLGYCIYYSSVVFGVRWQQYKLLTLCFVGVVGAHIYLSILFQNYFI